MTWARLTIKHELLPITQRCQARCWIIIIKDYHQRLSALPDRARGRVKVSPRLIVNLHWRQSLTQAAVRAA